MNKSQILEKLKKILEKNDIDVDELLNRKQHALYTSSIELLLDHLQIVMTYMKFDSEASKREVIMMRKILEEIDSGLKDFRDEDEGTGV